MNLRPAILCAAAGFTGWLGVAWWDAADGTDSPHVPHASPASLSLPDPNDSAVALRSIRAPAPGSAGLAALPALVAAVPADGLSDAWANIEKWPPGTARDFATALVHERWAKAKDPSDDPPAPPEEATEPPYNRFRELAESMTTGYILYGPGTTGGCYNDYQTLYDWVAMDPAAAIPAVMKMPPGNCRSAGVETAAEALAKTRSAAGLEFVLKSGEQHLGGGAADAWSKLIIGKSHTDSDMNAQRQFLDRMTRSQQDSLFAAMAESIQNRDVSDPLPDSDIGLLARCVLQTGEPTPGMESFFEIFTRYPQAAEEVRQFIESCNILSPAHEKALEILWAQKVESVASAGLDAAGYIRGDYFDSFDIRADHQALLDRVAPSLVSKLATSDRLTEAVELLDRIHDPDARRRSLEAVLPAWLGADPDAARAAFDAAPLTALERERWLRHPAFLLHP